MRCLDDFSTMPRCSSPIEDIDAPSSSKSIFKKPFYPANKPFMRPADFIDISDDDEIEFNSKNNCSNNKKPDQTSSHSSSEEFFDAQVKKNSFWEKSNIFNRAKSKDREAHKVLQRAKSLLAKNNAQKSSLNESIRLNDYAQYRKMIESQRSTDTYLFNGTPKNSHKINNSHSKSSGRTFGDIYKNTLKDFLKQPKTVIDLTASDTEINNGIDKMISISIDSDSDSDVKIVSQKVVSPVNTLKKRLDIEPFVNDNWMPNW